MVKRGMVNQYCDSRWSAWLDPPGTAASCNRMQWVNKASCSVWRVEMACSLKHDQQSMMNLSPAYTHPSTAHFHVSYIKYPWTLDRVCHRHQCVSANITCLSFTFVDSLIYSQDYRVTNNWTNECMYRWYHLLLWHCRSRSFHSYIASAKNL